MKLKRKIVCAIAAAAIIIPTLTTVVSCSCFEIGGGGGGGGGGGPSPKPPAPDVWSAPELTWVNSGFDFATKPGQPNYKFDKCVHITRSLYTDEKIKSISLVDFSTETGSVEATVNSDSISIDKRTNNISFEINLDIADSQRFDEDLFSKFKFKFEFEYKGETGESIFDKRDSAITVNYKPYGRNYVTYKGQTSYTEIIGSSEPGDTSFTYDPNVFRLASPLISELGEDVKVEIIQSITNKISFTNPDPVTVDGQGIEISEMNFNPDVDTENETYDFKLKFTISTTDIEEVTISTFNFTYEYYRSYVKQEKVSWTGTDADAKFITTSDYNVTIGRENASAKLKLGRPLKDDESVSATLQFSNEKYDNLKIANITSFTDLSNNGYVKIDLTLKEPLFMDEPVEFKILFNFSDKFGPREENVPCMKSQTEEQVFQYQYKEPEPASILHIDDQTLYDGNTLASISCILPEGMKAITTDIKSYEVTFDQPANADRQQEIIFKTFAGANPKMAENQQSLSFTLMVSPNDFYADQDFENCVVKFTIGDKVIESNKFKISYKHEQGAFKPLNGESKAQDPNEYIQDRSFSILTGVDDSDEDANVSQNGWILSRAPAVKLYDGENFTYYFVTTWRFQGGCETNYSAEKDTSYIAFGDNEHATFEEIIDQKEFPGATPRWFSAFKNYWIMRLNTDDFKWVDDIEGLDFYLHAKENWYSTKQKDGGEPDVYFGDGTANIAVAKVNFGASIEKMQQEAGIGPSRALALKNKLRKLNDWTLRSESQGDQTEKGHINNLSKEFVDPNDGQHMSDFFYCSGYSVNSLYDEEKRTSIPCSTFENNYDYVYYDDDYDDDYVLRGETSYNDYNYKVAEHARTGHFNKEQEKALIAGIKDKAYFRCPRYNWTYPNAIRKDSYWNGGEHRFKGWPNFGTFGSMLVMPNTSGNLQILGLFSMAMNPRTIWKNIDSSHDYYTPVWDTYVDSVGAGEHHYDWNILGPYDKTL